MTADNGYPGLTTGDGTRDSLHAYCKALGALRASLTPAHPRWWHVSLQVSARGFETGELPGGAASPLPSLALDLVRHRLTAGGRELLDLSAGPSPRDVGEAALAFVTDRGARAAPERERWDDPAARPYQTDTAECYRDAFARVAEVFAAFRSGLPGEPSPIQLWPHNFDLSLEWFGSRSVSHEREGETVSTQAQIGFGFSTGDAGHPEAYFYANPWPFEERFAKAALPAGAGWHLEEWQGALLPYSEVTGRNSGKLQGFLDAVFELASPALSAN